MLVDATERCSRVRFRLLASAEEVHFRRCLLLHYAIGSRLSRTLGRVHGDFLDREIMLHRLAPLLRATVQVPKVAIVCRKICDGEDLGFRATTDGTLPKILLVEAEAHLVGVLAVARHTGEDERIRLRRQELVSAVIVRVMPLLELPVHASQHLVHDSLAIRFGDHLHPRARVHPRRRARAHAAGGERPPRGRGEEQRQQQRRRWAAHCSAHVLYSPRR
mmetsp:Transcript_39146/g.100016  ORF Transcript_39146/g.100016 Transcript_39146/m.100016 type:complete len:219 (-) Transcript_39146:65-721(-)